ncbi:MAG: 2OG-Fe(II) oxygenase [Pseudomonadota bacterium]|nr:2OG-Fe(II) oxygenase [Pseudomonadota bacterium]
MNHSLWHTVTAQLDHQGYAVLAQQDGLRWCEAAGTAAECLAVASSLGQGECLPLQLAGGPGLFPFVLIALLSVPDVDFTGGECVMTEQRPRRQSRALVVPLCKGDALIIHAGKRPGALRYGISTVRSGRRNSTLFTWKLP